MKNRGIKEIPHLLELKKSLGAFSFFPRLYDI